MKRLILPLLLLLAVAPACKEHGGPWDVQTECEDIDVPGFLVQQCARRYFQIVPFLGYQVPLTGIMYVTYIHHPKTLELISFAGQTSNFLGRYELTVTMGVGDPAEYLGRCSDPINYGPDTPGC